MAAVRPGHEEEKERGQMMPTASSASSGLVHAASAAVQARHEDEPLLRRMTVVAIKTSKAPALFWLSCRTMYVTNM